jgi:hypothetical protein
MRYMMLVYARNQPAGAAEMAAVFSGHAALMEETLPLGILLGANPLKPPASATTVIARPTASAPGVST